MEMTTSQSQSIALPRRQANWNAIRVAVGLGYLACEAGILVTASPGHPVGALAGNVAFVAIGIAAAFFAYQNSRSFSAGQTARYTWMLIAAMPLADAAAYTAYTMPAYLGASARSGALILTATALLSISRIVAAVAFFSMVRVYRNSGLPHRLELRDYLVMGMVLFMEAAALAFSGSGAQQSGGPQLAKLILITALPLVIALVPCSVLGVIIWRYTAEMGGGLVAKAWRSILLYGVAWLSYLMFNAMAARYFPVSRGEAFSTLRLLIYALTTWQLKGSEYLIFLGATYQHEACTGAVEFADNSNAP
jgi:hypothetical protein